MAASGELPVCRRQEYPVCAISSAAVGGLSTHSVIQFRAQAVLPGDVDQQLLAAIDVARKHLEADALVTVDPLGHRMTVLPISSSGHQTSVQKARLMSPLGSMENANDHPGPLLRALARSRGSHRYSALLANSLQLLK